MSPNVGSRFRWLALVLAAAALTAGCGAGGASDDVVKGAANALGAGTDEALRGGSAFADDGSRAYPTLTAPARRAAVQADTVAGEVELRRVGDATFDAFCAGWSWYKDYGAFPTGDEWYDLAEDRIGAVVYPTPLIVSRAVRTYEAVEYGFDTGNITAAQIDLTCALR